MAWIWRSELTDLASAEAAIRHVFGDTPITEASIGAAPPENNIAQWVGLRELLLTE